MGDFTEDRQAAGELILFQRQQVAAIQAVHRVSAHSPVEVVHCLSLQKRRDFRQNVSQGHSFLFKPTHALSFISHSHAVNIQTAMGAFLIITFQLKKDLFLETGGNLTHFLSIGHYKTACFKVSYNLLFNIIQMMYK